MCERGYRGSGEGSFFVNECLQFDVLEENSKTAKKPSQKLRLAEGVMGQAQAPPLNTPLLIIESDIP